LAAGPSSLSRGREEGRAARPADAKGAREPVRIVSVHSPASERRWRVHKKSFMTDRFGESSSGQEWETEIRLQRAFREEAALHSRPLAPAAGSDSLTLRRLLLPPLPPPSPRLEAATAMKLMRPGELA
jgi:hypothetical protein